MVHSILCVFLQVIVGPETADGPWYFGLNSRRLWVIKRCREEGLLENNRIYVRVREFKSDAEAVRYSVKLCALEAKIVPDPEKSQRKSQDEAGKASAKVVEESSKGDSDKGRPASKGKGKNKSEEVAVSENLKIGGVGSSSDVDSDSDDEPVSSSNRFSALF
jgi:hypothetical protein